MRTVGRRGLLGGLAGLAATAVASSCAGPDPRRPAEPRGTGTGEAGGDAGGDTAYRFVSAPDFMNGDVADLSSLRRFRPGTPNSWNDSYAAAVATVMDAFVAERPDDVLVAGDLVNGHWGVAGTDGVFGPTRTERQRRAAVRRAARAYYGAWRRLFTTRDLPVHVAVGDHEVGDNDWRGSDGNDFKRRTLGLFKAELARHVLRPERYDSRPPGPAADTAYATRLHPDLLLVTVDVFEATPTDVVPRLDPQQLAWLDDVLADARDDGVTWIVVQGHVPVIGPVRQTSTSGLTYAGGSRSGFWRTLVRHEVDLYLCGEVHDITARQLGGVTQISHGGIFGHAGRSGKGGTNYLVADVDGEEMTLTAKRFRVVDVDASARLWQATEQGRPPVGKTFAATPDVVGTMRLRPGGRIVTRSGLLAPYEP